jgi:hypothetical protein
VDLAGSEKATVHETSYRSSSPIGHASKEDRVREGQHINRSLFFLTQVIAMLA